jgi:hypothetical protein
MQNLMAQAAVVGHRIALARDRPFVDGSAAAGIVDAVKDLAWPCLTLPVRRRRTSRHRQTGTEAAEL